MHAYFEGHRSENGAIIVIGKPEDRQKPWDCGRGYAHGANREPSLLGGGRKRSFRLPEGGLENVCRHYLDIHPDRILIPKGMESGREKDTVLNGIDFAWTKEGFWGIRIRNKLI